jgi:hypothetical protein
MRDKFRIFGRVLGIAIRYSVTPGVRFTPGALWLLSTLGESTEIQPSVAVIEDLVLREDEHFFRSISSATLADFAEGTTFGSYVPNHPRSDELLTESNLADFKMACMQQFATRSIRDQIFHIYLGMSDTIRVTILHSLIPSDFANLFVGSDLINVSELLANTSFHPSVSAEIQEGFSEILLSFNQELLEKFLLFVSASPKPPVGGFASVTSEREWMHVQEASTSGDPNIALPTAHTCFVLFQVPKYTSKEVMKERIIFAITYATTIEM